MPKFKLGRYYITNESRKNSESYYIYWYDKQSKRTRRASTGTSDFQAAQRALAEFVVLHDDLKDQNPTAVRLEALLIRYYDRHAKHLRSAETSRNALRKWSEYFGECMVSDLTPDRQRGFIDHLKGHGYKNEYVNRILTTGRAAINYAYGNQEISTVPPIKLLPAGQPRDRILSLDEAAAIFSHADEPHLFMFCMIAFNTLARPEAILELTPFQIDFESRLINLNLTPREQTKKHRPTLPITKTLMPWLRQRDATHYVNWHGQAVKSIKTTWRKMRKRAGLSNDVIPYTIRHTMATELRKRGVPPWECEGFLGHKSGGYKTTERYAKFAPDYLGKAVEAIDGYFGKLQRLVGRELVKGGG